MKKQTIAFALAGAAILTISTAGSAVAGSLITSHDIKDNTVRSVDIKDGGIKRADLSASINKALAKAGQAPASAPVAAGAANDGLTGVYYATADYSDVNAGAMATVKCDDETDVALSGGVQIIGVGQGNAPVSSSFPGRMNWDTNTPKADRLDGWIVQFGGDTAPDHIKLWVLCAPGADVPVSNTVVS